MAATFPGSPSIPDRFTTWLKFFPSFWRRSHVEDFSFKPACFNCWNTSSTLCRWFGSPEQWHQSIRASSSNKVHAAHIPWLLREWQQLTSVQKAKLSISIAWNGRQMQISSVHPYPVGSGVPTDCLVCQNICFLPMCPNCRKSGKEDRHLVSIQHSIISSQRKISASHHFSWTLPESSKNLPSVLSVLVGWLLLLFPAQGVVIAAEYLPFQECCAPPV